MDETVPPPAPWIADHTRCKYTNVYDGVVYSAAPDLYDVVQDLSTSGESCGIDETDLDDPIALLIIRARAAVAKAQGKAAK